MQSKNGYYSLIQFCPDRSKLEAANVGVMLLSPEDQFISAKLSPDNARIRRFFGRQDWAFLNEQKNAVGERIQVDASRLLNLKALQEFCAKRANQIRITEPRSILISDPERDLHDLYLRLVAEPRRIAAPRVVTQLKEAFREANVDQLVRKDIEIEVRALKRTISAPFGYQNGRFNVIEPLLFETSLPEEAFDRACRRAIEGRSLYEHEEPNRGRLKLVVVGKFGERSSKDIPVVADLMRENNVGFFSFDNLEPLILDIRHAAQTHLQS